MNWIAVAVGGALGACLRYALALGFTPLDSRFPIATFTANALGSFLMGLGFILIVERAVLGDLWRHFLLIGLLGAFTTFSTFSIESLSLLKNELYLMAALYVLASVVMSLLFASMGIAIAKYFI